MTELLLIWLVPAPIIYRLTHEPYLCPLNTAIWTLLWPLWAPLGLVFLLHECLTDIWFKWKRP